MPPNAPKIPRRELDVLRRWIEGGLIEKAGDAPVAAGAKSAGQDSAEAGQPLGRPGLPRIPPHANAVTALAVSPVDPTVAVSGYRQVLVFDLATQKLLGGLPFPEGDVFVLKFSRDGRSLLAAGGVGGESGKAVVFDTKTWARASSLGDELDAVLAADLSPDAAGVVLGGPNRVVKVVANPGGAVLHTLRKPTDWVTAAAFSPDGLLVAAGDRFGGLFLWETRSAQEFLTLRGHTKAVNAIAWTARTDNLVTAGEDGAIQVWDLHTGKVSARWDAHPGGVLAIDVHPSGRIASAGRDRRVKVWELDGRAVADVGPTSDQATRIAWTADTRSLVSGDWTGEVRVWTLADSSSTRLPMPVAAGPGRLALVAPVLTPARRHIPKPPAPSLAERVGEGAGPGDDLEAALASAREAAAAAERAVGRLSRLARTRTAVGAAPLPGAAPAPGDDALGAAGAALRPSARPGRGPRQHPPGRAVGDTEEAVRLLERRRERAPTRASAAARSLTGPVAGRSPPHPADAGRSPVHKIVIGDE